MSGITIIFMLFVLIALVGFVFFVWREGVYFAQKNSKALFRIGASLLCFALTAPLLVLALAPIFLAAVSGLFEGLGRRKPALIMAALCLGALVYQLFFGDQSLLLP